MAGAADLKDIIPNPPKFSDEDMQRCRDTGDYKPVLFEWYKFVGSLCVVVANIRPDCPVYRAIPPHVLRPGRTVEPLRAADAVQRRTFP